MSKNQSSSVQACADDSIGMLMHHVRVGLIRHLERELVATGCELNFSQFRVIKMLAGFGPMTSSELARSVEYDAGALTRMLDRLHDKGYVVRRPREEDRRSVDVMLTEAGSALWLTINDAATRINEYALSDLSGEERSMLASALKRVRATLER